MTHSNANEGRTQKDARQALKLWELQTGGSSSPKEGNAYMDGYNDGWDARERRSEEDVPADAPAPADASRAALRASQPKAPVDEFNREQLVEEAVMRWIDGPEEVDAFCDWLILETIRRMQ